MIIREFALEKDCSHLEVGIMPTIGILGGAGPWAALDIEEKILFEIQNQKQTLLDQNFYNVVNLQCTQLYDRRHSLLESAQQLLGQYLCYLNRIICCGADILVIACNSAHTLFNEIREASSVPILSVIEETVNHIRSFAPSEKIGLLASDVTHQAKLYDKSLSSLSIHMEIPSQLDQQELMKAIRSIKAGCFKKVECKSRRKLLDSSSLTLFPAKIVSEVIENILEKGCEKVIFGCTELPLVIPMIPKRLHQYIIDPNQIIAEAIVREAVKFEEMARGKLALDEIQVSDFLKDSITTKI